MQEIWKAAEAAAWSAAAFGGLLPFLEETQKQQLSALVPKAQSVFVAAFPYAAPASPGNIALYARGEDYHRVLERRLTLVAAALAKTYPQFRFHVGIDASPLPEKQLAVQAGLGKLGRNSLLFVPPYGSYVFLGTILTDLPFTQIVPHLQQKVTEVAECAPLCAACHDCRACVAACPTGALGKEGLAVRRCLSQLSQRKGPLTAWEEEALRASPLIWGCDICQQVCPQNRAAQETGLPEFREELCCSLQQAELSGLTQKAFRARFGARAFSWRGIAPLLRNLQLQAQEKNPPR